MKSPGPLNPDVLPCTCVLQVMQLFAGNHEDLKQSVSRVSIFSTIRVGGEVFGL